MGGTKLAAALVDEAGRIVERTLIPDYREQAEDEVMVRVAEQVKQLCRRRNLAVDRLAGIGICTCGHVDHERGRVITNSNLPGFKDYPLGERLRRCINRPIVVDNDANAQGLAEYRFGAARGCANAVFVTVSTGIGAGIVIGGGIYHGMTGTSGEIGHTIINPFSTIRCGCGNYGCLMSLASGQALPQALRRKLRIPGVRTSMDFAGLPDSAIGGELIKEGLDRGDPLCMQIVDEYADYLGIGMYNVFQTFNPEVIVLGGGLTAWGDRYLERVRGVFYRLAGEMMHQRIEIKLSSLGPDAALIGAAALVLSEEKR